MRYLTFPETRVRPSPKPWRHLLKHDHLFDQFERDDQVLSVLPIVPLPGCGLRTSASRLVKLQCTRKVPTDAVPSPVGGKGREDTR